jgi:hypothetical protein
MLNMLDMLGTFQHAPIRLPQSKAVEDLSERIVGAAGVSQSSKQGRRRLEVW